MFSPETTVPGQAPALEMCMTQHVTIEQWASSGSDHELGSVFGAIASAAAQIAMKIRLAGFEDIYGAAGVTNVQGEQQQKLDVFANEVMISALRASGVVAGLVSEEDDNPVVLEAPATAGQRRFVRTIFGVRVLQAKEGDIARSVLRPGSEQVAAGYVLYGPSTIFVATTGDAVSAFTLNDKGEFLQSTECVRMPGQGIYYSANEANLKSWPAAFRGYIPALLRGELGGKPYSARYVGSLVADFHRTLLKGGVFLYPPTEKAPKGKLRLQYEANPLAMIAEAAGGAALDGAARILDIEARDIHERTPLVVGSRREVELLQRLLREASA